MGKLSFFKYIYYLFIYFYHGRLNLSTNCTNRVIQPSYKSNWMEF